MLFVLLATIWPSMACGETWFSYLFGSRVTTVSHPPVIRNDTSAYVTLDWLTLLAPAAQPETGRYLLGGREFTLTGTTATLDGSALSAGAVLEYNGQRYLRQAEFEELGFTLTFNPQERAYQFAGSINRIHYESSSDSLVVNCQTPVRIHGYQQSDTEIRLEIMGGVIPDSMAAAGISGSASVSRLDYAAWPVMARSEIVIHQPQRTGFKVRADDEVGYARVKFGNYFQLADYRKSSSGELSVAVTLGAPCPVETQQLSNPPRIVADFSGVEYEDATLEKPVNIGAVKRIRVGRPEPGKVRVVLDLERQLDYRVLTKDGGAQYYLQLLPHIEQAAPAPSQRVGRTIMVDPGHGGSDPGAEGVIDGVWEVELNTAISAYLVTELESLGYDVLTTRSYDRYVSLQQRADYANQVLPYIFVSIHNNWIEDPEMTGAMTFHHPASSFGPLLAALVQDELVAATGAVDKGVRTANFFVLRETVMPSILVECGFMSNYGECRRLLDPEYQQTIARAIARGVDRYVAGRETGDYSGVSRPGAVTPGPGH
jgi:N-acetylmuramoyl-L-alanine amidase